MSRLVVSFNRLNQLQRLIILAGLTTPPLLLMLTVFMPPGFAGVPYMCLVLIVFLTLFIAVAVVERSLVINSVIVVVFWASICVVQVMNPGTAPGAWQRIHDGLLQITLIGTIHLSAQLTINWAICKRIKIGSESVVPRTDG